jgi:hypothetical protein
MIIFKYYKHLKNKEQLKKVLFSKYGQEEGLKKYNAILRYYKSNRKNQRNNKDQVNE